MAKFIINNLVYDTEKMERVAEVEKVYPCEDSLWDKLLYHGQLYRRYKCDLYRSKKGRFLLTRKNNIGDMYGEAIEETEAKQLLMQYDYDTYTQLFGELDEA